MSMNVLFMVFIAVVTFLTGLVYSLSRKIGNLENREKNWPDSFKAISFDLARNNQETFLSNARTLLESFVTPLKETFHRYEEAVKFLEKDRLAAYTGLEKWLEQLHKSNDQLQKETANLVNALRRPEVRGRWGELTLRRSVELAGMVEHCDFDEQLVVKGKEGVLRPDMIVHLPTDRVIVVDAKVPLDAYLDALSKTTEEEKKESFRRHAHQFRQHLDKLSNKSYWGQFEKTPEFVVMFVAGEAFLSAALAEEEKLVEDGFEKQVILANPSTLVALLRTIAYGWKEVELARNAREIGKLGKELFERFGKWIEHFTEIGESLEKAVKSYNGAIGTYEKRILPTARKFQELGGYPEEKSFSVPVLEEIVIRELSGASSLTKTESSLANGFNVTPAKAGVHQIGADVGFPLSRE